MFPESFNFEIYKKNNKDLENFSNNDLISHYNNFGINEGRICSKIFNRETLSFFIDTYNLNCLEIGPFDCPFLKGEKVKYFDVLNQEGLKKRSIECNRPFGTENVPYIDYVSDTGKLNIINEIFDIVLSCHSIEHQIDFVEHLKEVSRLLKTNGYYVIILPDKRYCFDHFINESNIADVLEQHFSKRTLHSIKSVIEHRSLICHNNSFRHWNNDHGNQVYVSNPDSTINAINEYNNSIINNIYIDVHSLQFTPKSFENIINQLNRLNYIDLNIDKIYPTIYGSCEFYVILKKNKNIL